jgi:hypothetical protein
MLFSAFSGSHPKKVREIFAFLNPGDIQAIVSRKSKAGTVLLAAHLFLLYAHGPGYVHWTAVQSIGMLSFPIGADPAFKFPNKNAIFASAVVRFLSEISMPKECARVSLLTWRVMTCLS